MKKVVLTLALTVASIAAFAQGKIGFSTDSLHLAYWDPAVGSVGGSAVIGGALPAGVTGVMVADLYMGTSSSSLAFYSSTTFSSVSPGKWNSLSVQAQGGTGGTILGGTAVFVEVQIRDNGFAAPTTFAGVPFGSYYGASQMFQFTLGSGITYPTMYTAPSWTAGTFALDASAGAGAKGVIQVSAVPEPASFALCGLGAAALMIFRRRK